MAQRKPYPNRPLKSTLRIVEAIFGTNSGNDMSLIDIAQELGMTPTSGPFRNLVSSSSKFGLTKGGYTAKFLSPTELAKMIMEPVSDEMVPEAKAVAFRSIEGYQAIETRYSGKQMPKDEYGVNWLKGHLQLSKEDAERCWSMFKEDCEYLGWFTELKGKPWLQPTITPAAPKTESFSTDATTTDEKTNCDEDERPEENRTEVQKEMPVQADKNVVIGKKVFISHHEKKKSLALHVQEQLHDLGIKCELAEYNPHKGKSLLDKVVNEIIPQCGFAIFILTKDIALESGGACPSQSVLFEVGYCYATYSRRVVLLCERGTEVGALIGQVGRYDFEGENIDTVMWNVARELIQTGFASSISTGISN